MSDEITINVPDIGGATDVDVIDVLVKVGDPIEEETSLITLEGDKATMDIPSPHKGKVVKLLIKVGDKASKGTPILVLKTEDEKVSKTEPKAEPKAETKTESKIESKIESDEPEAKSSEASPKRTDTIPYASPSVRRIAREFGIDLYLVKGTGHKGRISKEDVQSFVKSKLNNASSNYGLPIASPRIDFSQFGDIDSKPLNKIKKLTGENMQRAWLTVPHVTQFDEADITELEAFRKEEMMQLKEQGIKLTLLAFVCKVVCQALKAFPQFNSSLDVESQAIIYKKYIHLGIAVETPNGLVVPVIRNADQLSVIELAKEMARLSHKARDKGLAITEMSGGSFTVSSLGGIGGTYFTPIVNYPEVAILGLSRSSLKPIFKHGQWVPRLLLPLSLSYDHRVIDGAEAARFTQYLTEALKDIRRILL